MVERKKTTSRVAKLAENAPIQDENIKKVQVNFNPYGSSGTELFAGYFSEEYLQSLRGTKAADAYDKMRRSDAKIKMALSAVKNPIKGATWKIVPADDSESSKKQAALIDHIIFHDMEKTWDEFISEALSVVDFGHAVFEITHKAVLNHPEFGSYNGVRSLGFRSQRTIERWNLSQSGVLESIEQQSYGDVGKSVSIPGQFCLVFSLEKEGDNYEGISLLRPCFGSWSRKQVYLKLVAIGVEKSAIPTPVASVPEGKENSDQFTNMIEVLKAYTSHQSNYITKPAGWEITFLENPFDGEKIKGLIQFENEEIVSAFLANFLALGTGGNSGAYSLSFDLSDFFLGGIEYVAKLIASRINLKLIPELIKMNFGPQSKYPQLKYSGISDKIGQELGVLIRDLVGSKVITPDNELEKEIRRRLGLPKIEEKSSREVQPKAPLQFSEIRFAETPKKIMTDLTPELKKVIQSGLTEINKSLVDKLIKQYESKSEVNEVNAVLDVASPSITKYKSDLQNAFSKIALKGYTGARGELPSQVRKTLSENPIRFAEFDQLPEGLKKRVKAVTELTAETQLGDLEKAVKFQYLSSIGSTDSSSILQKDLLDAGSKFIDGPSVDSGSATLTSQLVNEARQSLFDEAEKEIESYTFINGDPQTPICQDLNGTTFDKNDPESLRYLPPLHYNCKSYLVPNFKQNSDKNPELTPGGLKPSDKSLEKYVQFSDKGGHFQC